MSGPKERPMRGGIFFAIKDAIWPTDYYDVNIDPQAFGDPFVDQTQWTIMQPGGANFPTFRLAQPTPDTWFFKSTRQARGFGLAFAAFGFAIGLIGILQLLGTPPVEWAEALNCPLWDCSVQVDEHGVN